jgi:hypothetical protein
MLPMWLTPFLGFWLYVDAVVLLSTVMTQVNTNDYGKAQLRMVVREGQLESSAPVEAIIGRVHQIERTRALAQFLCASVGARFGPILAISFVADVLLILGFLASLLVDSTGGMPMLQEAGHRCCDGRGLGHDLAACGLVGRPR